MILYPYAIFSDVHCNDWSAFSHVLSSGINNRLQITLDAIKEVADKLESEGGRDIVITGDLFHTRGNIKPSVFNPTFFTFVDLCKRGFRIWSICGNHDLEGRYSEAIGDAMATLGTINGFTHYSKPYFNPTNQFRFVPWIEDKNEFIKEINKFKAHTLFCHIGIDGVLDDVKGKVGKEIFNRGFHYVFAGDYHNHRNLGSGIYSVGALTHHNFGDVGSVAGYLIVRKDKVEHFETKAPKFKDNPITKRECWGNYIRINNKTLTEEEAASRVKAYKDYGALAVVDYSERPTINEKTYTNKIDLDLGLNKAIENYCKNNFGKHAEEVISECRKSMT